MIYVVQKHLVLIQFRLVRVWEKLIINPENVVCTKASPNFSQVNVSLVSILHFLATQEFRTHPENDLLFWIIEALVVVLAYFRHYSTCLRYDMEAHIFGLLFRCWKLMGGCCDKIDPLKNLAALVVT